MKKKLITLAVASAFVGASSIATAGANVSTSGFIDTILDLSDEAHDNLGMGGTKNDAEKKFSNNAEVDISATNGSIMTRVDVDLMEGANDLEQAYFSWAVNDMFSLTAGRFNSGVGLEANDAPDMWSINHGLIWDALSGVTSSPSGNNVEGITGSFAAGPANVTIGILNELQRSDEENSTLIAISGEIMPGLDAELSHVTSADAADAASAALAIEGVTDFNLMYKIGDGHVAIDYASFGAILDSIVSIQGGYSFGQFGVFARHDTEKFEASGTDDTKRTTLSVNYAATDNLTVALESTKDDDGTTDTTRTELEFVATF